MLALTCNILLEKIVACSIFRGMFIDKSIIVYIIKQCHIYKIVGVFCLLLRLIQDAQKLTLSGYLYLSIVNNGNTVYNLTLSPLSTATSSFILTDNLLQ